MSKTVTIILDSGCLMPKRGTGCEIGYYQSGGESDLTLQTDKGSVSCGVKLGTGCARIDIKHLDTAGNAKTGGIKIPEPFCDKLLHMYDLYGCGINAACAPTKFDYILCFESGEFRAAAVKPLTLRLRRLQTDGKLAVNAEATRDREIAHDLTMGFTLEKGESIVFTVGEKRLWSSDMVNDLVPDLDDIRIKVEAGASTTEKFYRHSFASEKTTYWMPSVDDPPPWCPEPPCPDAP